MAWLRLVGSSPLLVGLFVFIVVHPTVGVGISAAENTTVDASEVRSNVTVAVESYEEDAGTAAKTAAAPYLEITDAVLGSAFDFGYEHPDAAAWYRRLSPAVVGASLLAYAYGTYRDIVEG